MRTFMLTDRRTGEVVFDGVEASRSLPCWVCGDRHRNQGWCLLDVERRVAICPRVESQRRIGEAGWWHGDGSKASSASLVSHSRTAREESSIDWAARWSDAVQAARQSDVAALAASLRLTPEAVGASIEVGIERNQSGERSCWAFAMRDASGSVCGLKLRMSDGRKLCAKGSRLGIIRSRGFSSGSGDLYITEGESDLMVAAGWGLNAIARPGCRSCVQIISAMSRGKRVVIVSDLDDAGRSGALALRDALKGRARDVSVVLPEFKDLREWHCNGGTADDLAWLVRSVRGY